MLITVHKNYIKYTPFQSRSAQDYVKAFDSMITFFRLHGKVFKIVRMDNETSTLLEDYFTKNHVTPEYVAPGARARHQNCREPPHIHHGGRR